MPAPYTFSASVLSGAKTGSPAILHASLSAHGVVIDTLSANHIGLAFNTIIQSSRSGVLSTLNVDGSTFRVDTAYSGQPFALLKLPVNNFVTSTVFTYLSALGTTPTSGYDITSQFSTPESRRKRLLGYK